MLRQQKLGETMFKSRSCLLMSVLVLGTGCTTTEARKNVADSPKAIAKAPVKALNLKKTKIPDSLKELGNPYESTEAMSCASLYLEIADLTEFVGPDWDSDEHYTKTGRTSSEFFDAILPYGGIVRFVSGASEHEKKVLAAASYATVRRAYLKATSQFKNCAPLAPDGE